MRLRFNWDMADFARFDSRGYRTVDVRSGYEEWAPRYESSIEPAMDIAVLEKLRRVPWDKVGRAVDLGCGAGGTGAWLKQRGVASIDGVDLTPQMLALARSRGVYERLVEADVLSTGLASGSYDLVTTCLVDEHLAEVQPLYREAARLAEVGALYVLVGLHPQFLMTSGMPTHFETSRGEPIAIETHVHLLSEHLEAGLDEGWRLLEMTEQVVDDAVLRRKPKWKPLRDLPLSFGLVWRLESGPSHSQLIARRSTTLHGN
jgi:SAM-dependent methyltransferase